MSYAKISELVFTAENMTYLRPCFTVNLYFEGPMTDHAEGITAFYQNALEWFGDELCFFQNGSMKKPRRIKERSLQSLSDRLQISAHGPLIYKLFLESESAAVEAPHFGVHVYYNGLVDVGSLRAFVPAEQVSSHEDDLAARATALGKVLRFSSGIAGFGLARAEEAELPVDYKRDIHFVSRRFSGVDVGDPLQAMYAVPNGIKCVNWITFVGENWIEKMGGLTELRRALPSSITIHSLAAGVAIKAGPAPVLGDVNRPGDVDELRRVGKVLASVRSQTHPHFLFESEFERDNEAWSAEWLGRFDT